METKKLSFNEMEEIEGGDKRARNICNAIFFGTGALLGLGVAVYSAGTAAIAGWALSTYISGFGTIFCNVG